MTTVPNFRRTRLACYTAYFTMSSIFSVPPLLFVTFREMYGISYTLLGTLVLTNFCTQLLIDLIFTFFSRYFNVKKVVRTMPLITSLGLAVYALVPMFFPQHAYAGLLMGTIIFSVSAGLSEVLLSPVIAALPSENPQRDMSMLHSLYAFGVVFMIAVSTVFLRMFSAERWMYLILLLALLPVIAAILFMLSPMPEMGGQSGGQDTSSARRRIFGLMLCTGCIFFGSCAENAMSNWISSYMEKALHVDKMVGDILGMAMFAVLLGMARIGYARFGRNITRTLLIGMAGAACCYLVAGLSGSALLAFLACILTGLFTAMLWPGSLIMMEENIPGAGVAAFAMMAAGGDLGASIAPQLMGVVIDGVSASAWGARLAAASALTSDQISMKAGMLVSAMFPMMGAALLVYMIRYFKKQNNLKKYDEI